jgi:hypothetical protein
MNNRIINIVRKPVPILFLLLLSLLMKAQTSKDFINTDDILKALNSAGINIYKFAISSGSDYAFNILFEEFEHGKLIDSALFVKTGNLKMLQALNLSLSITKDTSFLRIITHQKTDDTYTMNFDYTHFAFEEKEIRVPVKKYGPHEFHEFPSPKITEKGTYPVLLLSSPWTQEIYGQTVFRFCFPNDIDQIKTMVEHFYIISVIAN